MSHSAFIKAIQETPDDDTVRLVYADFLEEDDEAVRAEFIRKQIALARMDERDPSRPALEDGIHELLLEHEEQFLGVSTHSPGMTEWEFKRGFVEEVSATPRFMLREGARLCGMEPVRRWNVVYSQESFFQYLAAALESDWIGRLEALSIPEFYFEGVRHVQDLERLLRRVPFNRLQELSLAHFDRFNSLADLLRRLPYRSHLKRLRFDRLLTNTGQRADIPLLTQSLSNYLLSEIGIASHGLTAEDVRDLLTAPCCRQLTSLDVSDNPIEPHAWRAFQSAPCKLKHLDLSGTPLGGISLDRVLQQESVSELTSLELNRCGSAVANVQALVESRFWQQAEELRMHNGTIPERALHPLFESTGPSNLRILDLSQNYVRDSGVAGLCQSSWANSLLWLGLSGNYLTDEALRTIANCRRLMSLQSLHLNDNHSRQQGAECHESISDAGCFALAESATLSGLRLLSLSGCEITVQGVEAILSGRHWKLSGLGLARCNFRQGDCPAIVGLLARAPQLQRFEWLDLGDNRGFGGEALLTLAESPYLSPLLELNIRGCEVSEEVHSVLRDRLGHRLTD